MNVVPLGISSLAGRANLDAEAAFLGAVLIENSLAQTAGESLRPEHFFDPVHARIYERTLSLMEGGKVVTPVTLRPYFERDEGIQALGGVGYLARLTADGHGLLAPRELAEQIVELAQARVFSDRLREALDASSQPDADLPAIAQSVADAVRETQLGGSTFPFLSLDELASSPPPDWLVDDLIGEESLGFVFGQPGTFKSFIVADIGLRISYGMPWHGAPTRQAGVLYIAAEGAGGIGSRVTGWRVQHDLQSVDAPFVVVPMAVQFLEPDSRRKLIKTIDRVRNALGFEVGLTIIDTVSRSISGIDENATEAMSAFVATCDEIRAHTGGAVLGVHHAGKDGAKGMRGSTVLLGAADFVIRADRSGDTVTLTVEKQKEAAEAGPFSFDMATVDWNTGSFDEPGQRRNTRVPMPIESSPADQIERARDKLTGHKRVAYDVITKLLANAGRVPPEEIPASILDRNTVGKVVSGGHVADKLQSEFLAVVTAAPDKKADTAKRTARRALMDLKAAEILASWEDWLWIK